MSWQKCDSVDTCALTVPAAVIFFLNVLHLWLGLGVLTLELPSELTVLLLVIVARSFRSLGNWRSRHAQLELGVDNNGRYYVNEYPRSSAVDNRNSSFDSVAGSSAELKSSKVNDEAPHVVTQQQGEDGVYDPQQYTCCRSVRVPGCILLTLVDESAKPLEILVFYRYYQREFYQRLLRRLALR